MKPRINVITLAVNDLEKSLAFYRDGLGLPTKGIIATEFKGTETEPAGAVVFFMIEHGASTQDISKISMRTCGR